MSDEVGDAVPGAMFGLGGGRRVFLMSLDVG